MGKENLIIVHASKIWIEFIKKYLKNYILEYFKQLIGVWLNPFSKFLMFGCRFKNCTRPMNQGKFRSDPRLDSDIAKDA